LILFYVIIVLTFSKRVTMNKKLIFLIFPLSLSAVILTPIEVSSTLEEIEEESIDEASSLNIVDTTKIKMYQVDNLNDVTTLIPNLNISGIGNRSNKTFTLRGVSNYVAYESSMAVYVDDIPLPFSYGYGLLDMNNVTSLEVTKGAHAALFGKGAESGVMKLHTHAPTKEKQAKLSLELGSYRHSAMSGYFSGPTDHKHLNYSLAFTKERSNGYATNRLTGKPFDAQDMYALHARLHYKPSNRFDLAFNYSKLKSDDGGSAFTINSKENIRSIDNEPIDEFAKLKSNRLGLLMNYKWGDYHLRSSTSYVSQDMDKRDYVPILGGLTLLTDTQIEEFTQDLRLQRTFENADLTLGLFYSDKVNFDYTEDQILLKLYPTELVSKNSLEDPDEMMALSSTYEHYLNEKILLTAGFRYQESQRDFERIMNNFGTNPTQANASNSWKKFLPMLSASYSLSDKSILYANYAKGFRIGGYNYRSNDTLTPYKEETTTSYELGYKNHLHNGLSFNSALFYNTIKDMRVVSFSDTLGSSLSNANRAKSYGLELDMAYKKEALLLYGTLGLTKATYNNLVIDGVDYSNNNVIDTPQTTASLGLQYDFSQALYLNSSLNHMGKRYYNVQNRAVEDGYTVTNLTLGYKHKDWEIQAYAKNIFDKEYVDFMIYTPSNNYYHFGAPQVLGVKVSKEF